jgi:hypothetical protein
MTNGGGKGGSGGTNAQNPTGYAAGVYGGGVARSGGTGASAAGGAVRIIWPGCARSFPSTRTADE